MKRSYTYKDIFLGLICILLLLCVRYIENTAQTRKDPLFDTKILAYEYMEECMNVVCKIKSDLGIKMTGEDIHNTGMIGHSFSPITTSLGSIEAKRTSSNPDMAALVVELLHKSRIKEGDRVGAIFSGSFPSLNIAVLSACRAMGVEITYISSVGSSNYGANNPELTFPDMALKLADIGLITNPGVAFSIGGTDDLGVEMEQDIVRQIVSRIESQGLQLISNTNYQQNLALRQQLLENNGPISCFINVGGNVTSLGNGENSFYFGQGLLVDKIIPITEKSGLIEIYRNKGIPVIHLLNLRKLTTDYGLGYDPLVLPQKGTSSIYLKPSYNQTLAIVCLLIAVASLLFYRRL